MENYLRSEQQKLKEDKHLNDLVTHLNQQNKSEIINEMREHYEPPMIPNVSDERIWNDHLGDLSKDDWSDISGVDRLFKTK
jgi:hypothetical protein